MSVILGYDTIGAFDSGAILPRASSRYFNDIKYQTQIYDEVLIKRDEEITTSDKYEWDINTYLLAKFLNNLEAGNVGLGGLTIDQWKVKRRKITSTNFEELGIVPMGNDENFYFLDTSPQASVTYEYEVIPMAGDIEGQVFTTQIECNFEYWWISDGQDESYPLFANFEISDIIINKQRHQYDGFNEFPTISYGNQKYKSGTITAYLFDSFVETNRTYRDNVINFINNGQKKYIRNPYGDVWIVDTHTSKYKLYTQYAEDNISSITFEFTEIDKVKD